MNGTEVLLEWQEPKFVIYRPDSFTQHLHIAKGRELRLFELQAFLRSTFGIMWFALVLTCIAFPLLVFVEPNSSWYNFGIRTLYGVVAGRIFVPIIFRLCYILLRSHRSQKIVYQLSRENVIRIKDNKQATVFHITDISRVLLQEIRYDKGHLWVLRVKHRNRAWYELGIPENLRAAVQRAFQELQIPFGISSKPRRSPFWFKARLPREVENPL